MSKRDGGPAFPVPHCIDGNWVKEPLRQYSGMTLRDHFAAAAMQGMLCHTAAFDSPEHAAQWAYGFADQMLKEREK